MAIISCWTRLKEEKFNIYWECPGIWPAVIAGCLSAGSFWVDAKTGNRLADTVCTVAPTVTGMILALVFAAITFQLGAFSDEDLQLLSESKLLEPFQTVHTQSQYYFRASFTTFSAAVLLPFLQHLVGESAVGFAVIFIIGVVLITFSLTQLYTAAGFAFICGTARFKLTELRAQRTSGNEKPEREMAPRTDAGKSPPNEES